jgi:hypothetical protein
VDYVEALALAQHDFGAACRRLGASEAEAARRERSFQDALTYIGLDGGPLDEEATNADATRPYAL